jgi:phosphoserine aminotransferase
LIEKSAGSKPANGCDEVRRYERHWTPVHIDFHVEDFEAFLAKAISAGANVSKNSKVVVNIRPSRFAATRSAMVSAWWE